MSDVERRVPFVGKKPKLRQLRRISAIAVVYILSLGVVGLALFYVVTTIAKAFGTLTQDASQILPNGLETITAWLKSLDMLSSPSIQANIDAYAANVAADAAGYTD